MNGRWVVVLGTMLSLSPLACARATTAPNHPPREHPNGEGPVYTNSLMIRTPPPPNDSALPTPLWSRELKSLYLHGCGRVVDAALTWARARTLATESHDGQSQRYAFIDVAKPHGYFYVVADWNPSLHGSSPTIGYIVRAELTFYSYERLNGSRRQELQYSLDVPALEASLEVALHQCGWFEFDG